MARRFFGRLVRRAFQAVPVVLIDPVAEEAEVVSTDATPDAFAFFDILGAIAGELQVSNTITVSGLGAGVFVSASVSGDSTSQLRKNGGAWQSAAISVQNGDTLAVSNTSPAPITDTTLTVGGVSDTFTATRAATGAGQPVGLLLAITKAA